MIFENKAWAGERNQHMTTTVRVGLLGCGNIGTTFALTLRSNADRLQTLTGLRFELVRIVVQDPSKPRDPALPAELFTADVESVVAADDIDAVVELMGGIEPAGESVDRLEPVSRCVRIASVSSCGSVRMCR